MNITTSSIDHYDFSNASREEFVDLFEFASTCNMSNSEPSSERAKCAFIAILLESFTHWQEHTGFDSDVMPSVQFALCIAQLRHELTEVLFKHGQPTKSQIETTFRLLFQVAYVRQQLVTRAETKSHSQT